MRFLLSTAVILGLALCAHAQSAKEEEPASRYEDNTYRHGGTFETLATGSADSCASACGADRDCVAWSFRKPNTAAGPAYCELKQTVGKAEHNPLMTSGITPRLAESQVAPIRSDDGLLGGTSRAAPAISRQSDTPPVRQAVRQAPAPTTQVRESAFSAPAPAAGPTAGRIVSPADPRIIRDGNGAQSARPAPPPRATVAPPPRQAGAAPIRQATPGAEQPYDDLRNRRFPQYSVQKDEALDADKAGSGGAGS